MSLTFVYIININSIFINSLPIEMINNINWEIMKITQRKVFL
jgi:hypothetical protein